MPLIRRISKQTGGDLYEFRDAPLLRSLARRKTSWPLLLETPLGLYDPKYHVDLKEGSSTQKDRLNMLEKTDPFNVQIAKLVGLSKTLFPSQVLGVTVQLREQAMTHLIARLLSVETEEGIVEFDCPFTPNCLTFTEEYKSRLWLYHLKYLRQHDPFTFLQAANRIDSFCTQVISYRENLRKGDGETSKQVQETLENNLLILSRFWEWLGIDLGLHVTRFPDQPYATITMTGHGRIQRGIELKYDSNGYTRAGYKSKKGGREMIILCFEHNDRKLLKGEDYLDVIDVSELGRFMVGELEKIPTKESK